MADSTMWMALILSCGINDATPASCYFNYSIQPIATEEECNAIIEHDAKVGAFRVVDPLTGDVQDYYSHQCIKWTVGEAT